MEHFHPHILNTAHQDILSRLENLPPEFILYGGTAVALRFGHRKPLGFDFYSNTYPILNFTKYISNIAIKNVLSFCFRDRDNTNHVDVELYSNEPSIKKEINKIVKLTFLSDKNFIPGCLEEPSLCQELDIKIASPIDLFCHKIWSSAKFRRIEDYIDIIQFIKQGYSLEEAFCGCLAFAKKSKAIWEINFENVIENYNNISVQKLLKKRDLDVLRNESNKINLVYVNKSNFKVYDSLYNVKRKGNNNQNFEYCGKKPFNIEQYAQRIVWTPNSTVLKDIDKFLAFILAQRRLAYFELVEYYGFTDDDFVRALSKAEAGVFRYEYYWKIWHQKLKIKPIPPFPIKYRNK